MSNMVQYGVWSNCCNQCDFCLREERIPYSKDKQLFQLDQIKKNIKEVNWKKFTGGISLLGGELYYITDVDLQESFLDLIDIIINHVIKKGDDNCKYSTVTNGLYDPSFLFKVIDKLSKEVGINHVDVNFSYDLKYRYRNEESRLLVLKNINLFHDRYNYDTGVQMILTQYLIDKINNKEWDINYFLTKEIPGNNLSFLYPHPIHTGLKLKDFFIKRQSFLDFIPYLRQENESVYEHFLLSTKNSATFKYTGLRNRTSYKEQPILSDGKEIINPQCGHSTLYQCYSDSNACMLCDLENLNSVLYL